MSVINENGTTTDRRGPAASPPVTGALPRTEAVIRKGIESGLHRGGQVAVVTRDGTRLTAEVGEARPGTPMAADTLLPLYCAARPLLVLALARLSVTHGLSFDDPVRLHVPEFAAGGKHDATVRHLLLHTAGIRDDPAAYLRGRPWDVVVDAICAAPLEPGWLPGEHAAYQRFGYWYIVGEVVARASGRSLDRYLREEIAEPLGLLDTWAGMPLDVYESSLDRLGSVVQVDPRQSVPVDLETEHFCCDHLPFSPRGTMSDLAGLYRALLNPELFAGVLPADLVGSLSVPARVGLRDHGWMSGGSAIDWTLIGMLESRRNGRAAQLLGRYSSDAAFGHFGQHVTTGFADPEPGLSAAFSVTGMLPPVPRYLRTQAVCGAIYSDVLAFEG
jgi:CubicO group peptidase (beta-lactamase class C family)